MPPAPLDPPGDGGGARVGRCPICGKPAAEASKPFCSPRCRDVDLHRWFSGTYVVPGREDDEENAD